MRAGDFTNISFAICRTDPRYWLRPIRRPPETAPVSESFTVFRMFGTLHLFSGYIRGSTARKNRTRVYYLGGISLERRRLMAASIISLNGINPNSINDAGQVTGGRFNSGSIDTFIYGSGTLTNIGVLPGGRSSSGLGINQSGQVVGYSDTSTSTSDTAFYYDGTTLTNIGTLTGTGTSEAEAINNVGEVVGFSSSLSGTSAFVYNTSSKQLSDINTLSNSNNQLFDALSINDSNQIVGIGTFADGQYAFLYNNTTKKVEELNGFQPDFNARDLAINNLGDVSGAAISQDDGQYHAILYSEDQPATSFTYHDLGLLQGYDSSEALSINGQGDVVGAAYNNLVSFSPEPYVPGSSLGTAHAFIYDGTNMVDLNTLLPANSGWVLRDATSINNNRQIIGYGSLNGSIQSYLLTLGDTPYSPAQIRKAYGINALPSFSGNKTPNGMGQTIAIISANNDPHIVNDVDVFDRAFGATLSGSTLYAQYGAASSFLTVVDQNGNVIDPRTTTEPLADTTGQSASEESLDVEWSHAIAPKAHIIVIECNSDSYGDIIGNGVSLADLLAQGKLILAGVSSVSVVSISYGYNEQMNDGPITAQLESQYDTLFKVSGVTYLAASGDFGTTDASYPAFSPDVVAVGGTTLTLNSDNTYGSEIGWSKGSDASNPNHASGGGPSSIEVEPAYQQMVQNTGERTIPDVAFEAGIVPGVNHFNSYQNGLFWKGTGGTSLSTPCWAGLIAIIDQGRVIAGSSPLTGSTQTLPALYDLSPSDFHDNLGGFNGTTTTGLLNTARYDEVTGLGTPVSTLLVPDLVAWKPVSLSPGVLPAGTIGVAYSQTITASGGTGTKIISYIITSGAIPAGLTFSTQNNQLVISGTATVSGSLVFTLTATDTENLSDSQSYTLTINSLDVTSQISSSASGLIYNRSTQLFGGTINLTNTGSTTLTGVLEVVLTGLPTGVSLANASGYTADGNPYILVDLTNAPLAAGQSINFTVLFANPKKSLFQYGLTIFNA